MAQLATVVNRIHVVWSRDTCCKRWRFI